MVKNNLRSFLSARVFGSKIHTGLVIVLILSIVMAGTLSAWPGIQKVQAITTYQTPGAVAYSAINGTSIAPAYPASIALDDLLVLIIGMKPSTANSGSVTTPSGWTAITSITGAGGYGTTLGADTGNTNLFTYYKVAAGTETGSLTVTIATNNVSWAQMYRFSNETGLWDVAGTTGSDTTAGNVSIAFGVDPGLRTGDYILGAMCIPTDVTTPAQFSAESLTQSGITFGAITEISEPDATTGNDIGGVTYRAPVDSGTSAGVPTFTATAGGTTTNVRGPGVFIRVRQISPVVYETPGALAYSASGGTSVAPPYPASIAATDLLVLIIGMKPSAANSGSVTDPSGWTAITSITGAGGYGATLGADTGNTNLFTYYKVADGTETGTLTVTLATSNVSWAQMYRFSNETGFWDIAGTTGSDTTGDAAVSIPFGSDPGVTAGDHILGAMCIPTDVTTPAQFSAEALTQSGIIFRTVTEISEPDSATGNQIGGVTYQVSTRSGTSTGVPTFTATAGGTTTNVRGPGVFIRIRQLTPVSYQVPGAIAYSSGPGTSVAPDYPASIALDDLLVLIIGMKPSTANSGSVTTPSGWTAITSITGAGGYGTTLGADTGNTNLFAYYKVADGTETGTLTVTLATNNVSWAQMYRFSNATGLWDIAGTTGSDTTGDATVSIVHSTDPGVTAGDYILGAMCIPTDVTTPAQFSAEALTQSGITFGTVTEISEPASSTGNDIGGVTYQVPVKSGTSSGVPTFTATAGGTTTNVRGPGVFIRVRQLSITNLDNGTDPSSSSVDPGSTGNYLDQFTFIMTGHLTDSITALTVTTTNTAVIASVQIWNNAMTTQYFATVSSPSGNAWNFSGGTAIPVNTASGSFRVVFTATSASSLLGGTYDVTGTVTSYTCTNTKGSGTDFASATITVDNPVIVSFTITDNGTAGINFGSLDPAITDQPEVEQNGSTGAVTLVVGSDTNVAINIQIKGTDLSDGSGHTIAAGNVKYNNTDSTSGAGVLTGSYVTWYAVSAHTASTVQCYHWLTVPGGQTGGSYTSTFYYQALPQ